jgi:hypothetical protein
VKIAAVKSLIMHTYVFATWLIANLVHPFVLVVVFGWSAPFDMETVGLTVQFIVLSMCCSMPSFLLGFLAIYGIFKLPLHNNGK